jgi:hypothetical protein
MCLLQGLCQGTRAQGSWGVERAGEEALLLRRRGILLVILGRITHTAESNLLRLVYGLINAVLN